MTNINPFNFQPCKSCGRKDKPTGKDMKKVILAWAGINTSVGYSAQLNRAELLAIYQKIQEVENNE